MYCGKLLAGKCDRVTLMFGTLELRLVLAVEDVSELVEQVLSVTLSTRLG